MKIEKADKKHLKAIAEVIKDSIESLCGKDHLNKKEHIENWLLERSEHNLGKILFNSDSQAFVCINKENVVGVSHITNSGELKLCYVHSDYIGQRIGHLLLKAAEQQAQEWGLSKITMISTNTAKGFYCSHGYIKSGEQILYIGMPGYPLEKKI